MLNRRPPSLCRWKRFVRSALHLVADVETLALRVALALLTVYGLWTLLRQVAHAHLR